MGNRKCTAWLSSLTVLCYLCICTCVFQGKLQYIHTYIPVGPNALDADAPDAFYRHPPENDQCVTTISYI